ncbi:MAG TPA: complex I NDUFA9 subunit family protein [Sphingomicrobium sp.]|nr:complex I NDUFA9 subunit family protein [Sphingomicrobium sp.]
MIDRKSQLVTVFGGDGFVGRYVCEALLKSGVRVRIACREPRLAHFIQPLGQVGQFGFMKSDITNAVSARAATEGATAVVNLVGAFRHMTAVHVTGARHVAEAAAASGAAALVHISAIGADPNSESEYGSTKARGEEAVRRAYPRATIIRPSLVFGPEDELTNRFASMASFLPALPVVAARRRFQPVYVRDLARAIAAAALDPATHGGKTYEIGGPQTMTFLELNEAIIRAAGLRTEVVALPDIAGSIMSRFGWLPGAPMTRDQWLMLKRDNVPAAGSAGLEAFGIKPTPLAAVAPDWLDRHAGSRFARRRVNISAQ